MPARRSSIDVALVQTEPVFGAVEGNLARAAALLAGVEADLVVLPELFATGYAFRDRDEALSLAEPFPDGPTTAALMSLSERLGATVVGGLLEKANDAPYNSAAIVQRGKPLAVYRKIHLFGFESEVFAPGDRPFAVYTGDGFTFGTMICFDWVFPESARCLALLGADVIAHPSNLVTPGWCQQAMPIRALENHVAIATANRTGTETRAPRPTLAFTGESLLVEAGGREVARGPRAGEAIVAGAIDLERSRLKRFPSGNRPLFERRPELYGPMAS